MATLGMNYTPITASPPAGAFTLTTSPDGGWPTNQITNAIYYNGYTYLGYIDGGGNLELRSLIDGATIPSSPITLAPYSDWLQVDWHDAPALLVRSSDHKLVVAACRHASSPNLYIKISTNSLDTDPTIAGGFGSWNDIAATVGGSEFTYPHLHELTSEGKIYLFWRSYVAGKSTLICSRSSDGGATWEARTGIFQQNAECYWSIDSNGTNRIDFSITNGAGTPGTNVYHLYYTGGNFKKSDGTTIAAFTVGGAIPCNASNTTLVYDGTTKGARGTYSISTNGGNPVITFPVDYPNAEDYVYASYSAGWTHHTIVNDGAANSVWLEGGCALDLASPTDVYLSKYTSGQWQMFKYTTANAGVSWSSSQLTTSANVSIYPMCVRNYGSTVRMIWLYGTATAYTSYNFGIVGIA